MKLFIFHAGRSTRPDGDKKTIETPDPGVAVDEPEPLDAATVLIRTLLRTAYENPPAPTHSGRNKGWKR